MFLVKRKIFLIFFLLIFSVFLANYTQACVENSTGEVVNVKCADGSHGFTALYIKGTFCSAIDPSSVGCRDAQQCVACDDGSQACTPSAYRYLRISMVTDAGCPAEYPRCTTMAYSTTPCCASSGTFCTEGSSCCSGICCNGACASSCVPTCISNGFVCNANNECCSGLCSGGVCSVGSSCQWAGQVCGDNLSCCSPYTCLSYTCQCYPPCPNPSTYCPSEPKADGCGNSCPPGTSQACDVPQTPSNLTHTANTITSITWQWSVPAGTITKYQLFDQNGWLMMDNISTTNCSGGVCTVKEPGLMTNYSYARRVKACNTYGCSVYSNSAGAYTSIQPVVSVACTSIGETTIQITAYSAGGAGFSGLASGTSGIRFQRTGVDAGYQKSQTWLFSGLTPSTSYTFTAGPSRNGDGETSAGTAQIVCSTIPITPVPAPPANLRHTNNTASSIAWTWNPSTGATSYNIYIQCQDGETPCYSNEWRFQTTIVNTTYTQTQYFQYLFGLTNLEANTRYGIAVSACNVSGCSGASIATAVCSMPTPNGILCSNITKTSLRATAQTFFPKISNLSSGLYFRETSNSWNSGYIQTPNWDLSQLIPGTVYTFFVKARNQEGDETPEFGPKTCTTLALNIPYSLRTKHPDGSILKLSLISVADALLLNKGTVKTRMPNGVDYGAYLVETTDPMASPVRVMTPMGIKAWRKAP